MKPILRECVFEMCLCLHIFSFHCAGEYERVQKKAFTNWVNSHLVKVCKPEKKERENNKEIVEI